MVNVVDTVLYLYAKTFLQAGLMAAIGSRAEVDDLRAGKEGSRVTEEDSRARKEGREEKEKTNICNRCLCIFGAWPLIR